MSDEPKTNCFNESEAARQMVKDIALIRLAVIGNKDIGVTGLVDDVKSLKDWRRKLDLRIATGSGCVMAFYIFIKWIVTGSL